MIFPPMLMRQMFAVVTLLSVGLLHAQNLEQLQDSFKSDLESALTVLSAAQKKIADEKVPLSKKINELEARVIEKRQELSRLERSSDNQLVELNALKTQTKGLNEEKAYLNGLISEYAQLFETRIHITEVDTYQSAVRALQSASKNPDLSPEEFADAQVALLDASIDRLESLIGGKKFTSDALAPSGVLENGEVILMGPFAVFASSDTASAGLAQLQLGSPKPTVVDLGAERTAVIRQLSDAGKGEFPVDPTMGNALKIAATQDNLIEHMKKGGPVMLPIVGLGLAAVLIALMKWLQLSSI